MDWSDLSLLLKFDVAVVHACLLGQTVFLIMWAVLPWWKEWVGRALMIKSAALWILFSVNLALFWWSIIFDHFADHELAISFSTHVLVLVGIWSQVVALGHEMRAAKKGSRKVTGTDTVPPLVTEDV